VTPEESTIRLYHRLEDGLGRETATALTEYLDARIGTLVTKDELKAELSGLELRLSRAMFAGAMVLVGTNVALFGSLVAIHR
jgi:hypothetical protein